MKLLFFLMFILVVVVARQPREPRRRGGGGGRAPRDRGSGRDTGRAERGRGDEGTAGSSGESLRFDVGDDVECNMGDQGYVKGQVILVHLTGQEGCEQCVDGKAPYGVELENGQKIAVPLDEDEFVRVPGSGQDDVGNKEPRGRRGGGDSGGGRQPREPRGRRIPFDDEL